MSLLMGLVKIQYVYPLKDISEEDGQVTIDLSSGRFSYACWLNIESKEIPKYA